jgi:hypothetical protein
MTKASDTGGYLHQTSDHVESPLLEILHMDIMSVGTSMKCSLAYNHTTYEWKAPMGIHLFGRLSRLVVGLRGYMVRFLNDRSGAL